MGLLTAIRKLRYPVSTDAFNPPLHIKQLADDVDARLGESAANAAALPLTDNWPNRTMLALDTKIVWLWDGTAWRAVGGFLPKLALDRALAQAIPAATTTKVQFAAAEATVARNITFNDADDNVTILLSGIYRIHASVTFGAGSSATRAIYIFKNAGQLKGAIDVTGGVASIENSILVPLVAGDVIDLRAFTSVANSIWVSGGNYSTLLELEYTGPA